MKRYLFFAFLTSICLSRAFGNPKLFFGLETGYFSPQSQDFRNFYGGGLQIGAEFSFDVLGNTTVCLGIRNISKTAQLSFTREDITLNLFPIHVGLGLKSLPKSQWHPFIGGGLSLNIFREKAPLETLNKTKVGYWGQAGILIKITKQLFIEGKCLYNNCHLQFPDVEVNISGISGMLGFKYLIMNK